MVECKRCYLTIAAMKEPSSSEHSISKKRKTTIATTDSTSFELCSFDTQFPDTTFSLKASVSSTRTVLPYVSATNVSIGETLVAGNWGKRWLSPSEDFAFGFHQLDNDLYLLAISYQNIPRDSFIWYANGDNPAPKGSKLELNQYTGLVLKSPQGVELWTSQLISGTISYGLMNDTGNFQLLDENSQVLWDSFSNPTDTLVPTQIMEVKGTLSSRQKEANFSRGRFQFRLLPDGNAVLNPINLPTNYTYDAHYISATYDSTNTTNSGFQVIFDNSGLYILKRSGEKVYITNPKDALSTDSYYYRATINFDGTFTISNYPKNPASNPSWTVMKTLPDNICMNLLGNTGGSGVCGFNSICTLEADQRPKCSCPEGYSPLDSRDEYGSCKPNLELGCGSSGQSLQGDLYFMKEMANTDWPVSDYELYKPYNSEDCKTSCLQDCLCAVSIFRDDSCYKKKLPLSNGRRDRAVGASAFIKLMKNGVSLSPPNPFIEEKKYKKDQDTLITVISVLLGDGEVGNEEKAILTDWAYDCYRAGRIDILLENDDEAIDDTNRLERFVMVAIWCLQEDPSLRPPMKKVMLMLEGIAPVTIPPSPSPYTSVSVSCG
ncbi:hypothetical protein JHK87_057480 [Glycine soja]|nr:hypothetical protein JHK87_057480 [Glycine soja]